MPDASPSALTLAAQLRASDDEALRGLLTSRRVDATGIRDFFDLAEALLTPESVRATLAGLDRFALAALAAVAQRSGGAGLEGAALIEGESAVEGEAGDDAIARALDLALVERHGGDFSVPDPVRSALADLAAHGLTLDALRAPHPPIPLAPVNSAERDAAERLAIERATGVVVALTELLWELARQPARPLARGGIALPDAKRLAEAAAVPIERIELLRRLALAGALVERTAAGWAPSTEAHDWLRASGPERWARLAGTWLDSQSPATRKGLRERARQAWRIGTLAHLRWLYPAADKPTRTRLAHDAELADALGFSGGGMLTRPAAALALEGAQAAARALESAFPAPIEGVYVQHDLTVIAPGPLRPDLEAELRAIADVVAPGIAATYRVNRESVTRALAAGGSADSIRATLERLSLTGVPQPLAYLVDETARRYGSVRVGETSEQREGHRAALAYVRSDDAALLAAIEVDQSLVALRLQRTGTHRLLSRAAPAAVYWALSDARYPVAFERDEELVEPPVRPERHRGSAVEPTHPTPSGN
ncbi:helicase-associated domain-containing protein [Ruicaihuangia caeni]|uniref:Helicase-associated domain-containing protein n=1 Tax=Ruicaihuangia caeni TaxID=3042517 RepID=A0AAW6T9M6_9MICO|nr:helicase-associated domain-containing protein [Klugiella sp. YN-L-19]MDI2098770.1 helicase-associated domain-containing protein [Klugiella sp. YN-L-19]